MKKRLDHLLVERGLAPSRTVAQAMVMAGLVSNDSRLLDKPGMPVPADVVLHVKAQHRYVSRAGDKLASVAQVLDVDFDGKIVLDVGSSTGGFTDYALQQGAFKVYAVDVGTAQLAYKLQNDTRVISMEKTDIRKAVLPEQPDIAVVDVSFIALEKILPAIRSLVRPDGVVLVMAKPQFEAGKAVADQYRGVIPMGPVRDKILDTLREQIIRLGFVIRNEADSGLAGQSGNVEHFMKLEAT